MKLFLPIRSSILLTICFIFSFQGFAQTTLNGGSVAISTPCYSLSAPAPVVNSVTPASGGTSPYAYQWEAKNPASPWVDVIGGNGLTLSPGTLFGVTSYRRKVTDATGAIVYSNTVTFSVADNLNGGAIRLNTSFGSTILVNTLPPEIVSISDAYNGSGNYNYSWETSNSSAGPWSTISDITTSNYQPPTITTIGSTFFRRKSVDVNCGNTSYSNTVEIKTVTTIPFTAYGWVSTYLCVYTGYTPTKLSGHEAYGGVPPYSYQWEQQTGTGSWVNIPGATGLTYQPPVITATTKFRYKSSDAAGSYGYSNEDAIVIVPITSVANPGTIAASQTLLVAPNAPSPAVVNVTSASNFNSGFYQWQTSTDNGNTFSPFIPNYTNSDLFIETQPTVTTCYRRAIHDACASLDRYFYTNTICISPAQPLDAGTISTSIAGTCITAGTSPGLINGNPATGGSTPYAYQWQKNDNGSWSNIIGAISNSYSPGVINHNTTYRRQVTDAANTVLYSNEVIINLQSNVALKGGIVDGPIITCTGTAPGIINNIIDACGGGGNLQYTWESTTASSSWSSIASTNSPTHNATSISASTKFRRKVGDGCGNTTYSNEVEVFVYPAIEAGTITPVSQTVCGNGVAEVLSLMQSCHYTNGNVSYQWQRAASLSGPWTDIRGTAGTQPFYQARPSATYYYRLKVSSSVCGAVAYSNVATINVNDCIYGKALPNVLASSSLSTKGNMKVYPNPATQGQSVFITVDAGEGTYKAILRGTDGRAYNCTVTSSAKGQLQVKLPQPMAKGTYLIQVSNNQQQWIERILVQ